jgi:hypothetical protein
MTMYLSAEWQLQGSALTVHTREKLPQTKQRVQKTADRPNPVRPDAILSTLLFQETFAQNISVTALDVSVFPPRGLNTINVMY